MDDAAPPYPTVDLKPFDYVDFGCSAGGSIAWARDTFGGRKGLGVDISPAKVAAAREAGWEAMLADATRLDQFDGKVRFSTMIHFLEHLPSIEGARAVVATGLSISRDFLFIRQPWFDSDGDLLRRGLKLYWSHWTGHPLPMTSLQMYGVLWELGVRRKLSRFAIYGRGPIGTSDHEAVLPLGAGLNRHAYDPAEDGPKPSIALTGVFTELVAIAAPRDPAQIDAAAEGQKLTLLFDSGAPGSAPPP